MSTPATELRRSTRPRSKPAYADHDDDAELERGGKRRRNAAGTRKGGSGKNKDKPKPKPKAKKAKRPAEEATDGDDDDVCSEDPDAEAMQVEEEEAEAEAALLAAAKDGGLPADTKRRVAARLRKQAEEPEERFVGDPVPDDEARRRWPERYTTSTKLQGSDAPKAAKGYANRNLSPAVRLCRSDNAEEEMSALCHYASASVGGAIIHLGDDVYVKAEPDKADYIGRITEFFQGDDNGSYFTCCWFFRVKDTVIESKVLELTDHEEHDKKRVFLSHEKDVNMIESIVSKVNITYVDPNVTPQEKAQLIENSDLYYDMLYSVEYSTFSKVPPENVGETISDATSDVSSEDVDCSKEKPVADIAAPHDAQMQTATVLDLYSGCGAMSTGLCLGAASSGLKLNTKWAVDMNTHACDSLKKNHPNTQVRNEKADNFLSLLRQWDTLCKEYVHNSNSPPRTSNDDQVYENEPLPEGTFEVEKLVDICYGDPNNTGKDGLCFKVQWKGHGPTYDTWEPLDGLSNSPERIKEFVESGYRESILPLPGCVDVICGGPPCQGISGLNRYRKPEDPLTDERNKQLVVFMDIVNYLRPKYVLMENVVDILKFANGFLGRYALSRLVAMGYQSRLGMMVAGYYGLPQFRMRAFLWGALPSMVLPKFPLPTHDAINRGVVPKSFSQCLVAYEETEAMCVEKALVLGDVISDLPKVGNDQRNDVMKYGSRPKTQFQRYIRRNRKDMEDYAVEDATPKDGPLFDHQPLKLNINDYERVRQIPKKKGANFRNLKGVQVGENNTVEFDPAIPRVYLPSGKPLVPNYAMTFIEGRSLKPFGRLWWDETVGTVVTRAEPHNQIILHPTQPRVLTVRENARLQGFPDYYRLSGPIKQKYIQVGNAVAVPVARALGYSLGQAYQQGGSHGDQHPLFKLPENFIPVSEV